MKIRVEYKQKFRGEIITDTYERYIDDEVEIPEIEESLYDDPHVIDVYIEVID